MMGPDYTQWHGMFEVANRFYTEFIPELRDIIQKGKDEGGEKRSAANDVESKMNEILNSDMHRWYIGKMDDKEKASRKKASEDFKKRYAQ